jgi:UDP-N-acetylglucosamine acyltransferase
MNRIERILGLKGEARVRYLDAEFQVLSPGDFVRCAVSGDVIPYGIVAGNHARLRGLNIIGMKRSGVTRPEIFALRKAYRMIFAPSRVVAENIPDVERELGSSPIVRDLLDFMQSRGKRQFTVPPLREGAGSDDDDD